MEKNIKIARKIKYINVPDNQFITSKEIKEYKNEEVLVLCTGTQGETNAALSKMADDRLRSKTLKKLIVEVKINCIKNGKKMPSSEKIVKLIFKKYGINKEELVNGKDLTNIRL